MRTQPQGLFLNGTLVALKLHPIFKIWECSTYTHSNRQPSRKVTWVWDASGNVGKSFLADWFEVWRGAYIVTGGKFNDIAYAFDLQEYVVFDYSRAQEDKFPYKLLEDFKVNSHSYFRLMYAQSIKRS